MFKVLALLYIKNYVGEKMIAEIIINRTAKKLNRTFDYHIPKKIEDIVIIGSKVLVPFGKGEKLEEGFVVGLKEDSEFEVKDIAKLEDNLGKEQISLARWMAKRYFCNVSDCIKLMLTPGTRNKDRDKRIQDKTINSVFLKKDIEEIEFDIENGKIKSDKQKKIIAFVKDNEGATIPEIEVFTDCSRAIVNTLVKNGYLEIIEKKIDRNPLVHKNIEKTDDLLFTEEQKQAYEKIEDSIDSNKYKNFLLFGVTGSRKNRSIYQIDKKSFRHKEDSYFTSA